MFQLVHSFNLTCFGNLAAFLKQYWLQKNDKCLTEIVSLLHYIILYLPQNQQHQRFASRSILKNLESMSEHEQYKKLIKEPKVVLCIYTAFLPKHLLLRSKILLTKIYLM